MKTKGFSLTELLVVLTVIGILLAFAAPNVFSLVQARTLSSEGSVLRNQLTYAQQIAVAKNADVEIRFFKWLDETAGSGEPVYSAFQLFQFNDEGELSPISSFFKIRAPSALSEEHSTLLNPTSGSGSEEKYGFISPVQGKGMAPLGINGQMEEVDYISFRFRPDGSTDLPNRSGSGADKDTWYLTLVQGEGAALSSELPRNYVCLQVNPYNGVVTEFRP